MSAARPLDPDALGAEPRGFGRGPRSPVGLRRELAVVGDAVVTRYAPDADQVGP